MYPTVYIHAYFLNVKKLNIMHKYSNRSEFSKYALDVSVSCIYLFQLCAKKILFLVKEKRVKKKIQKNITRELNKGRSTTWHKSNNNINNIFRKNC